MADRAAAIFRYTYLCFLMMLLIGIVRYVTGYADEGNLLVNSVAAALLTLLVKAIHFIIIKCSHSVRNDEDKIRQKNSLNNDTFQGYIRLLSLSVNHQKFCGKGREANG